MLGHPAQPRGFSSRHALLLLRFALLGCQQCAYGHLIPGADVSYVDRLDHKSKKTKKGGAKRPSATPAQPRENTETEACSYPVDLIGGGGRDRTVDLGVMNPTL